MTAKDWPSRRKPLDKLPTIVHTFRLLRALVQTNANGARGTTQLATALRGLAGQGTNTGSRALRSNGGLTSSVAWRTRAQTAYCIDGQVYTAAAAVRWLIDLGLIAEPSDLDTVGEDSEGVLCVSALAGLAAPWWRPDATATFTGRWRRARSISWSRCSRESPRKSPN